MRRPFVDTRYAPETTIRVILSGARNGCDGLFWKKQKMIEEATISRDTTETIESGPLCITDLFQNKSVA